MLASHRLSETQGTKSKYMQENTSYRFTPVATPNFLSPEATSFNNFLCFLHEILYAYSTIHICTYNIQTMNKTNVFYLNSTYFVLHFYKNLLHSEINPFAISIYRATSFFNGCLFLFHWMDVSKFT